MDILIPFLIASGLLLIILIILVVILASKPVKAQINPRRKEEMKKIKRSILDIEEEDF